MNIIKPRSPWHVRLARLIAAKIGQILYTESRIILIFVRHARTEYNVKKLYTGCVDIDFLPEGLAQAREAGQEIAAFLSDLGLTGEETSIRWICSGLWRAQHTLLLARHAIGLVPLEAVEVIPEFNERDSGHDSGTPVQHGLSVRHVHPGGNSLEQAHISAFASLGQVISATRPTKTRKGSYKIVVLGGHERVIQGLVKQCVDGRFDDSAKEVQVLNAKPVILIFEEEGWKRVN